MMFMWSKSCKTLLMPVSGEAILFWHKYLICGVDRCLIRLNRIPHLLGLSFGLITLIAMLKKAVPFVFSLGMLSLLAGCSTTGKHLRWYSGPPRAAKEVATVKFPHNYYQGDRTILLKSVDNKYISKVFVYNNTIEAELLPGMHDLDVDYLSSESHLVSKCVLRLNAESGHVYDVYMAPIPKGKEFWAKEFFIGGRFLMGAWIVDETTDKIVAGKRATKYFNTTCGLTGLRPKIEKGVHNMHPSFTLREKMFMCLDVIVDDPVNRLDLRQVAFKWYTGSRPIKDPGHQPATISFDGKSNQVRFERLASDFGRGKFKVEAVIDGETVCSEEFEITP